MRTNIEIDDKLMKDALKATDEGRDDEATTLFDQALALLEPGAAVLRRTTPGGAGPGPVAGGKDDGSEADRSASRLRARALVRSRAAGARMQRG